jgi:cobalt-zinc-cadmium efflux system protein
MSSEDFKGIDLSSFDQTVKPSLKHECQHGHHHHHHHARDHHNHHVHNHYSHSHYSHGNQTYANIKVALWLNLGFALIEWVGGYLTASSAIQADALHDFGDSMGLVLALIFQFFATVQPSPKYNFGYKRLSLVSAFAMSGILIAGSFLILVNCIARLQNPTMPELNGMFLLSLLGVGVNGYAAWRLSKGATQNEKAIAWHMMEDLLGWIAILVSSILLRFFNWPWLDPILAVAIAIIVMVGSGRNLWRTLQLFLQAAPLEYQNERVHKIFENHPSIQSVKSLRIWSLDGESHVLTAEVTLKQNLTLLSEWEKAQEELKNRLKDIGLTDISISVSKY